MRKYPYIGPSEKEIEQMLSFIGISNIDELYRDIPEKFMIKRPLNIPGPMTEHEVVSYIKDLLYNKVKFISPNHVFCGGVTLFPIPSALLYLIERTEFLTSYTPYQPEICQGVLQALFEYESLIAELSEMDVVNASMYDWSTSAAEAILMAVRLDRKGRKKALILGEIPKNREFVIRSYTWPQDIRIEHLDTDLISGLINKERYKEIIKKYSAVYLEIPYLSGAIEESVKALVEIAHEHNVLFILGMDLWLLPLLKPPGTLEVDIFVSDGQGFGIPSSFGGPLLGIFAVKGDIKLVRQMPGRIIGLAEDIDGKRAFTMILQTREQHIRREKATSNICTNESLLAIAVAIFISLMGPHGLVKAASKMVKLAHDLSNALRDFGLSAPPYRARFGREFIYPTGELDPEKLLLQGLSRGYLMGLPIKGIFENKYGNVLHVSINGFHDVDDIRKYVSIIKEVLGK